MAKAKADSQEIEVVSGDTTLANLRMDEKQIKELKEFRDAFNASKDKITYDDKNNQLVAGICGIGMGVMSSMDGIEGYTNGRTATNVYPSDAGYIDMMLIYRRLPEDLQAEFKHRWKEAATMVYGSGTSWYIDYEIECFVTVATPDVCCFRGIELLPLLIRFTMSKYKAFPQGDNRLIELGKILLPSLDSGRISYIEIFNLLRGILVPEIVELSTDVCDMAVHILIHDLLMTLTGSEEYVKLQCPFALRVYENNSKQELDNIKYLYGV